jgi:hypothetical protein
MDSGDLLDSLINSISRFGISHETDKFSDELDKFNDDLDSVLTKMRTVDILDDPDEQWEILKKNYRKIKYIYELINFHNLHCELKFLESLDKFLVVIDKQTQVYLQKIDWYESDKEFRIDSIMIRDSLESSLNQNDTVKKIKYIIDAYRILIHIVEDLRNERYDEGPPEESFLDEFERPYKRKCT